MACPLCEARTRIMVCDNDCGTLYCTNGHEWHTGSDGRIVIGHNLACDDFSDVEGDGGVEIETGSELENDDG